MVKCTTTGRSPAGRGGPAGSISAKHALRSRAAALSRLRTLFGRARARRLGWPAYRRGRDPLALAARLREPDCDRLLAALLPPPRRPPPHPFCRRRWFLWFFFLP